MASGTLQAFAGAYGVFLVTEAGFSGPEDEIQQGKNAADAAKEVRHVGLCIATVTFTCILISSSYVQAAHALIMNNTQLFCVPQATQLTGLLLGLRLNANLEYASIFNQIFH